jgi:hypothetical protein
MTKVCRCFGRCRNADIRSKVEARLVCPRNSLVTVNKRLDAFGAGIRLSRLGRVTVTRWHRRGFSLLQTM